MTSMAFAPNSADEFIFADDINYSDENLVVYLETDWQLWQ